MYLTCRESGPTGSTGMQPAGTLMQLQTGSHRGNKWKSRIKPAGGKPGNQITTLSCLTLFNQIIYSNSNSNATFNYTAVSIHYVYMRARLRAACAVGAGAAFEADQTVASV